MVSLLGQWSWSAISVARVTSDLSMRNLAFKLQVALRATADLLMIRCLHVVTVKSQDAVQEHLAVMGPLRSEFQRQPQLGATSSVWLGTRAPLLTMLLFSQFHRAVQSRKQAQQAGKHCRNLAQPRLPRYVVLYCPKQS